MKVRLVALTLAAGALAAGGLAASGDAAIERSRRTTPLAKVVQMLGDMLAKGKAQKQEEAVQFSAYRQFCDQTTVEKQRMIEEAKGQIEMLKADILKAETTVSEAQAEIHTLDADLATFDGDLKAAAKVREEERKDYAAVHKDYSESIDAIEKAMQLLKAKAQDRAQAPLADSLSLMQARQALRAAGLTAGGSSATPAHRALAAFLADGAAPEAHAYEFRSMGVVDMLEKLRDKFADERSAHEKEELSKRHAHELLAQDLGKSVKAAETQRASKVAQVARSKQSAATMKGDLQDTIAAEADDSAYLSDLTITCKQKAKAFDDRQKLRADEISAIEQAVQILNSDAVSGAAKKHLPGAALLSRGAPALLQQSAGAGASPVARRAAAFLAARSEELKSELLSSLAQRMREDPFAKVKKMITDLINRLLEQGNEEAQRKGWCDTELASNEAARTSRAQQVEHLGNDIDQKQSAIANLGQQIAQLADDLNATQHQVAEATASRQAESAANAETVKDARQAQTAVGQAITVLRTFYEQAAEATAFAQVGQRQEPPPIFEGAYQGMGAENGGIVAMLEVIQSDFARLESTTSADESTAQADYDRFMHEAAVTKAAKSTDMEHKKHERQTLEQQLVDATNDQISAQKELDAANKYYEKLKPTCIDAGESFEERTKRREEEIQSLQEALRILNGEDISVLQAAR